MNWFISQEAAASAIEIAAVREGQAAVAGYKTSACAVAAANCRKQLVRSVARSINIDSPVNRTLCGTSLRKYGFGLEDGTASNQQQVAPAGESSRAADFMVRPSSTARQADSVNFYTSVYRLR